MNMKRNGVNTRKSPEWIGYKLWGTYKGCRHLSQCKRKRRDIEHIFRTDNKTTMNIRKVFIVNYHDIVKDNMLNGDGIRVVLFESGCTHQCPGCQNPQTWDKNSGIPFDSEAKQELFEALRKPYIDGITFSGGDPLATFNRDETLNLIKEIKDKMPDKTVWVYTGYTKEVLQQQDSVFMQDLLSQIDVLVDGPFVQEKLNVNYEWAGSTNQRVLRKEDGFMKSTSSVYEYEDRKGSVMDECVFNANQLQDQEITSDDNYEDIDDIDDLSL